MSRVLLVDDDKSNRLTLSILLEDEQIAVDVAASFEEGRARLATAGAPYDVVLLDLHLGDGLGVDLAPMIRQRMPAAKVVLISGSLGEGGPTHGCDALLPKGAPFPDMLAYIRRATPEGARP